MNADLYPGSPLSTASGEAHGGLGVVVRDPKDGRFYGITVDALLGADDVVISGAGARRRVGRKTRRQLIRRTLDSEREVAELLGFIEIDQLPDADDRHPGFDARVVRTAPVLDAIEAELYTLRTDGSVAPTRLTGYGVSFDLEGEEGLSSYRGALEVVAAETAGSPAREGDAGVPVVTADGRLIGVVVAADDDGAVVAPLHDLLGALSLEISMRPKRDSSWREVAVARPAAKLSAEPRPTGSLSSGGRIAGVNIPLNKRVEIALTYIHGIGPARGRQIREDLGILAELRVNQLTDAQLARIREYIDQNFTVEGDLRRETQDNIKRLMDLACYRGIRHRRGLPVRGQRTHSNARTRKGPAKPIQVRK